MAVKPMRSMHADALKSYMDRMEAQRAEMEKRRKLRQPAQDFLQFLGGAAPAIGSTLGGVTGLIAGGTPASAALGAQIGGGLGGVAQGMTNQGVEMMGREDRLKEMEEAQRMQVLMGLMR